MTYIEAIEKRESVREYNENKLENDEIQKLKLLLDEREYITYNAIKYAIISGVENIKQIVKSNISIYTDIINAPHLLLPLNTYMESMTDKLNLGFMCQSFMIKAVKMGLGSSWMGIESSGVVNKVLGTAYDFKIKEGIIFGYAKDTEVNSGMMIKKLTSKTTRMDIKYTVYRDKFGTPAEHVINDEERRVLEISFRAPSPMNIQPWKIIISEDYYYFVAQKDNLLSVGGLIYNFKKVLEELSFKPILHMIIDKEAESYNKLLEIPKEYTVCASCFRILKNKE